MVARGQQLQHVPVSELGHLGLHVGELRGGLLRLLRQLFHIRLKRGVFPPRLVPVLPERLQQPLLRLLPRARSMATVAGRPRIRACIRRLLLWRRPGCCCVSSSTRALQCIPEHVQRRHHRGRALRKLLAVGGVQAGLGQELVDLRVPLRKSLQLHAIKALGRRRGGRVITAASATQTCTHMQRLEAAADLVPRALVFFRGVTKAP